MRIFGMLMLVGMLLCLVQPRAAASNYSYGNYRYSSYPYSGYTYYGAGWYSGSWYPSGYYQAYNYYQLQVNLAQFVPYLGGYYYQPYSTYQPPQAYPAAPLNAVAPVQLPRAADPHDCTAQTKALKDRLDALEKRFAAPVVPPPPAARPSAQAPQAAPLSGAQVFADCCLKCHNRGKADEVVEGKARGGKITLDPMTGPLLLSSYRQVLKGTMPKDKPLTDQEGQALLAYFDSLKLN